GSNLQVHGEIGDREHANHHAVSVTHGKATNSSLAHKCLGGVEGRIGTDLIHSPRAHAADMDVIEPTALRVGAHAHVPIGDDADELSRFVDHGNASEIPFPHEARGSIERFPVADHADVRAHDFLHCLLHRDLHIQASREANASLVPRGYLTLEPHWRARRSQRRAAKRTRTRSARGREAPWLRLWLSGSTRRRTGKSRNARRAPTRTDCAA